MLPIFRSESLLAVLDATPDIRDPGSMSDAIRLTEWPNPWLTAITLVFEGHFSAVWSPKVWIGISKSTPTLAREGCFGLADLVSVLNVSKVEIYGQGMRRKPEASRK